MKFQLTYALAALLAASTLTACDKDETKALVTPSGELTLVLSANSAVLKQDDGALTAFVANWNPISFSTSNSSQTTAPVPTYQVQFAKTADGFGYTGVVDAANALSKNITVAELNAELAKLRLPENVASPVFARVVAKIGNDTKAFASAPVALTITPYKECVAPNADSWALVGPAGNGWPGGTPATENGITLKWDCDANAYVVRTALKADKFKFRLDKKWDTNLGGPAGDLSQGLALTPNGSDLTITTAGTYTVKLTVTGSGATTTAGRVTVTP